MAGAVNIPIGLEITDLLTNLKTGGAAATQFATTFTQQFGSLSGVADAPVASLSKLNRELTISKRQISDLLVAGSSVPTDLAAKFGTLSSISSTVKSALNPTGALTGYDALQSRLSDTKAKMQDLLATGKPVPAALTEEYRKLEAEVNQVGRAFDRLPTSAEKLTRLGGNLQTVGRNLSTYVTAPLLLAGGAAFKTYADLDATIQGFKVTTGSISEAKKEFSDFYQLSLKPGLGFEEVEKAGLRFEALGFKSRETKRDIAEIGNAIALGGGGKTQFDSVITQFTQLAGKSKVLGDDLKPIVNASPVIAKAINEMFGSVDSEVVSKALQKAGKGPKDFINDLVNSLSTLERVQGGPLNALENFGDGVKIAAYNVSLAADNVFGLTGKINGLGGLISGAAEKFGNLNPSIQGTILGIAGLIGVVGPATLALGTLVKLGPSIKDTFSLALGALSSPVGIAIAAAAALAALGFAVYQANRPVLELVSNTRLLADVNKTANDSIATEKANLDRLYATASNDLVSKEVRVRAIKELNRLSPEYLGNLNFETIKSDEAADSIRKHALAILARAQARANEDKIVEIYKQKDEIAQRPLEDFKKPLNAIKFDPLSGMYQVQARSTDEVLKEAATEKQRLIDGLETQAEALVRNTDRINRRSARRGIALEEPGSGGSGGGKAFNYLTGFSENDLKGARAELAKIKNEIYKTQQAGGNASDLIKKRDELQAQINAATKTLKPIKIPAPDVSKLTIAEAILNRLTAEAAAFGAIGQVVPESLNKQIAVFENDVLRLKGTVERRTEIVIPYRLRRDQDGKGGKDTDLVQEIRQDETFAQQVKIRLFPSVETDKYKFALGQQILPEKLGELVAEYQVKARFDLVDKKKAFDDFQFKVSQVTGLKEGTKAFDDYVSKILAKKGSIAKATAEVLDPLDSLKGQINSALSDAAGQGIEGMATLVGGLIDGTVGLAQLPTLFGGILADLATTIGKAMIAFGVAGDALEKLEIEPITAVIAGAGLLVLGSLLRATVSSTLSKKTSGSIGSYAKGGVFSKETIGRFGEYPNASIDQELASPVSLMRKTFQGVLNENRNQFPQLQTPQLNTVRVQSADPRSMEVRGSQTFFHEFAPLELRMPDGSRQLAQLQRAVREYKDRNGQAFKLG